MSALHRAWINDQAAARDLIRAAATEQALLTIDTGADE